MVESTPTAALLVPQTEFLLEFFIVPLDDPAVFGHPNQFLQFGLRRKGGKPVLGWLGFALWPFDQQPLFRMRFCLPVIPMRRSNTDCGKTRTQRPTLTFPPGDVLPRRGRKPGGQLFGGNWLVLAVAPQQPGRATLATPWLGRQWRCAGRPNRH